MAARAYMRCLVMVSLWIAAAQSASAAGIARPTQGGLFGGPSGEAPTPIPLTNTTVRGQVSHGMARVVVSQVFVNPHRDAIEAVYVFPLPSAAAVSATTVRVAGRVIRGRITSRQQARDAYVAARSAGRRVITVEQERPNIFTQSVSQIPGGARIDVELEYHVPLSLVNGVHEFRFPMVVAPRSVVGQPDGRVPTGGGRLPDTTGVSDASRITPPLLAKPLRSGRDVDISLVVDEGSPLLWVKSPSHQLVRKKLGSGGERVRLAKRRQIPNRDLVIRYRPQQQKAAATVHRDSDGSGYLGIAIPIPASKAPATTSGTVVFLVDDSASMAGASLSAAIRITREALWALPANTKFAIVPLSGAPRLTARPASRDSVTQAQRYLAHLRRRSRSDARPALRTALRLAAGGGSVAFVTDGWFGYENELARMVARAGAARVFPVVVGSSPNSHLANVLALAGGGTPLHLASGDDPGQLAVELARIVTMAPLGPVRVRFVGNVHSVTPRPVTAVFPGRPARLYARFGSGARRVVATIEVGRGVDRRQSKIEVDVSKARQSASVPLLWARQRIAELELDAIRTGADHSNTIAQLGIEYSLLTRYTSFLARDEGAPGQVAARQVYVPVDVPQAVRRREVLSDSKVDLTPPPSPPPAKPKAEPAPKDKHSGRRRVRTKSAKPRPSKAGERSAKRPRVAAEPAEAPAASGADAAPTRASTEAEAADEGDVDSVDVEQGETRSAPVSVEQTMEAISVADGGGRWRLTSSLTLGASLTSSEDAVGSATVSVGAVVFSAGRFGFGVDLSSAVALDSDVPAIFMLAPRLSMALMPRLAVELGVGPTVTSDADLGAVFTLLSKWHLSHWLSVQLRYDHVALPDQEDVDTVGAGIGLSF